jgi:hypothetical protein
LLKSKLCDAEGLPDCCDVCGNRTIHIYKAIDTQWMKPIGSWKLKNPIAWKCLKILQRFNVWFSSDIAECFGYFRFPAVGGRRFQNSLQNSNGFAGVIFGVGWYCFHHNRGWLFLPSPPL